MKLLLQCLFFITAINLNAQPVLTRNNYFFIGDSSLIQTKYYTSLQSFNAGPSGVNVSWDFSVMNFNYPSVYTDTLIYVDPVGTPFYPSHMSADYSQSNLCYIVHTDPFSSFNMDYNYLFINADSLSFIGHWANTGGTEIWEDHCTDFLTLLKFPFTYNDTFTDRFERFYFDMSGSDEHWISGSNQIMADGYGTLVTPDGNILSDVLRIHTITIVRDSNATFGVNTNIFHNYYWYSESKRGYILRLEMTANDSMLIGTAYLQHQGNIATSVYSTEVKTQLTIFPNPGNGKFMIRSVAGGNFLLRIINSSGQIIKQENYNLNTGLNEIDFSNLSSGVYFIEILTTDKFLSEKIIVE